MARVSGEHSIALSQPIKNADVMQIVIFSQLNLPPTCAHVFSAGLNDGSWTCFSPCSTALSRTGWCQDSYRCDHDGGLTFMFHFPHITLHTSAQRLRIVEMTLDHEAPYFSNMRRRNSRKDSDLTGVVDLRCGTDVEWAAELGVHHGFLGKIGLNRKGLPCQGSTAEAVRSLSQVHRRRPHASDARDRRGAVEAQGVVTIAHTVYKPMKVRALSDIR